jgi:hypothetical protein
MSLCNFYLISFLGPCCLGGHSHGCPVPGSTTLAYRSSIVSVPLAFLLQSLATKGQHGAEKEYKV